MSDLYALLYFLRVDPWARDKVWKPCIRESISLKQNYAIESVQDFIAAISLRRVKSAILTLPPKFEENVFLELDSPWKEEYLDRYHTFAKRFGVDRSADETWDSAEFFMTLNMLRLFCDHPDITDQKAFPLPLRSTSTTWKDSVKICHLISDMKSYLLRDLEGSVSKVVVFSQWTSFLHW